MTDQSLNRRSYSWLFGCLFVAIVLGLALPALDVLTYPERPSVLTSLQIDAVTYDGLAASMASNGSWTALPALQPPGFVVALAIAYKLFGHSFVVAKTLLWLSLVASTCLAGWLANRVSGVESAWVAAALTATAPALRHYVGTIQYEVLAGAGLLWVIALALLAVQAPRARTLPMALAAGLAGGALTLTREVFVGVVPIVGLWMALSVSHTASRRMGAAALTLFLLGFGAPTVWWSALQSARHDRLIVLTDKGEATFALGNNPRTSGTFNVDVVVPPAGWDFVVQRPFGAVQLAIRKVAYFWGLHRDWWNVPRPASLWLWRVSGGAIPMELASPFARGGWILVGFIGAVSWMYGNGRLARWWVLPAIVTAGCVAHVVTLSSHRFAVPFLPVLFVVIAGPLSALLGIGLCWTGEKAVRLAVAVAVLTFGVAWRWNDGPPEHVFRAAALDAMNAENVYDDDVDGTVRYVPAAAGPRLAMLLADEYLPAGRFQLLLTAKRRGLPVDGSTPVARAVLHDVDGTQGCAEEIPAGLVPQEGYGSVWIPCRLENDGPATLIVEALGSTDLYFDEVALIRATAVANATR